MNVWVAEWDNRPTEVYAERRVLWAQIEDDIKDGMLNLSDIEVSDGFIYVDDWLNAHEVKLIV